MNRTNQGCEESRKSGELLCESAGAKSCMVPANVEWRKKKKKASRHDGVGVGVGWDLSINAHNNIYVCVSLLLSQYGGSRKKYESQATICLYS